jgi:hypothetical protein
MIVVYVVAGWLAAAVLVGLIAGTWMDRMGR